jgi:lipopolysaccharide biosynthesis glycosyltransferase
MARPPLLISYVKTLKETVTDNVIHLGIAFDQNYVRHFYALITSVLAGNRQNNISIHAIITGLSDKEQQEVKNYIEQNGKSIQFYQIDEAFTKQFVLTSHWSPAAYYRLFFPLLIPQGIERLIYLDTDTVVVNELAALYNLEMGGYPVAAVYDNWVKSAPKIGINEEGHYFNSGMMLINLPVWREQKVSERAFKYLADYPERIDYVDQCGLNAVLINNWKKLDWKFNVLHSRIPEGMSEKEKTVFIKDKVILHYTLDRPWKMLCKNPYRHLYHQYLKDSPYKAKNKYVDYDVKKLPAFLKIKLVEAYFNFPLLQKAWQGLKTKLA